MRDLFRHGTERYSAFVAAIFLCLGILGAYATHLQLPETRLELLLAALIISLTLLAINKKFLWVAVAIIFFAVAWHETKKVLLTAANFEPSKDAVAVQATVAKTWATGPGTRVLLVESGIESSSNRPLPGLGRLFIKNDSVSPVAGDRVGFRTRIKKPVNRGNPGEYDWELDCANNGICWLASVQGNDSLVVLRRGSPYNPRAVLFKTREAMTRFLDANSAWFLDGQTRTDVRAVHKGIVLGDMGEISPALNTAWADSGIAHALSASGVHIAIVAFLAAFIVKLTGYAVPTIFLRIPFRKLAALASIPAMVIYCTLVGARVPAIRSTIMGVVIAAAILLDRKWNSLNSLAISAVIILLVYPLSLFTPSFQLSFLAVAGIILVVGSVNSRLYGHQSPPTQDPNAHRGTDNESALSTGIAIVRKVMILCVVTSVAATLAITPLILQYFHLFPVYTVLANLVTDFTMTFALSLGLIASLIGAVFPELGSIILAPADVLVWLINYVADLFSRLPCSTIRYPHMGILEFLLIAGSAWALLWYIRTPSRRILVSLASLLCATALFIGCSNWIAANKAELKVVFLNVGKGDAIFVKPPASQGWIIDGGVYSEYFDAGRGVVLPFLDWTGASTLDGIIMTHPDMDHMGGLLSIVQRISVRRFLWNPMQENIEHLDKILSASATSGTSLEPASRERAPIRLGSAVLTFLNQSDNELRKRTALVSTNDSSVVCRVDYGKTSFLFTGDLPGRGEQELLASGLPLKATVLKVAHHGSKTSTTRRFLESVKPQFAVIAAAYPPSRGLPNMEVVNRLESAGARIFWTGRDGAITMESDGTGVPRVVLGKMN